VDPSLDLESLRCFEAVARVLHFRTAAENVALSPAAVSDRVRRLEDSLGVKLFERTTRRVRLTDAGQRLLPHARRLLLDAARCGVVARGDGRPVPYELTLGTRYELGLSWLQPALRPLSEECPERTLHLYMGDTADLLDRMERGVIDACVLSAGPRRPEIRQALLHPEHYVFVGAEPLTLCPDSVKQLTLVDSTADLPLLGYFLDQQAHAVDWHFARHLHLGGIAAIRAAVLDGWGVAVLPRYFVEDDLQAGRLVSLVAADALGSDHFRLLWRADHIRDAELVELAESLRSFPLK